MTATDSLFGLARGTPGPPYALLAIDDQPDLLTLYRHMFRDGPFVLVGEALDGRQGVDLVKRLRPHLVLLDLSMPTMDGLEALVELRRSCPDARVVILSGFGRARMGPIAQELGASAYVEKGITPAELVETLERVAKLDPIPFHEPGADFMRRVQELV